MTMKRIDNSWLPADDYGRQMPTFSVNLLVRDVQASLPFYRDVLGAKVHYADEDFAALNLAGAEFMLHSDHTYDHHPLHQRIANTPAGRRGSGAELRVMGIDPDAAESRAKSSNATIIQPAADYPHGWRDVILADRDGYTWAVGLPLKK
jgi:catechol 2,3-dioxygenase-like lactoylglutathione lyase family enzyme